MKQIQVDYHGKQYLFTYYWATIDWNNVFFVKSEDPEIIELFGADHFFIKTETGSMPGRMLYNLSSRNPDEQHLKHAVAEIIGRHVKQ